MKLIFLTCWLALSGSHPPDVDAWTYAHHVAIERAYAMEQGGTDDDVGCIDDCTACAYDCDDVNTEGR